jgi:hypothetical protein
MNRSQRVVEDLRLIGKLWAWLLMTITMDSVNPS